MMRILAGLVLLASMAPAQPADGIPVPVRVVAGRLVVRCDVSSPSRRIPCHLLVQLERPVGLKLHGRTLRALRPAGGSALTLHFPGLRIETKRWSVSANQPYADLTKRYAPQLNETALVGAIGSDVLRDYHLVLDLAAGVLRLGAPHARSDERPADAIPVEIEKDRVRLPISYGAGKSGRMLLATSRFDTIFDAAACRTLGHPAGDIGTIRIGTFDLTERVALRPGPKPGVALAATGLNLLKGVRLTLDRVNGFVRMEPTRPAKFPDADLAYFRALVNEDADPVEAWLKKHAASRLAEEAADLLMARRLRDEAEDDVAARAIRFVVEAQPEDRRTTRAWEIMQQLEEHDRSALMLAAGEIGLPTGRKDRDAQAVYKVHSRMGEVYLAEGERKKAWRHLLSAAFGYPDHGPTNYWLGRFYEQEGRWTRAFSRYLQATIQEETTRLGMEGLGRVQVKLSAGERLDVETVEKMITGKVPAFGAPDRFEPDEQTKTKRVVLAELFTNSHVRNSLASDLAFDGLLSHFPRDRVVVLVHHLGTVAADGLASPVSDARASQLGVSNAGVGVFDGKRKLDLRGRDEEVEERYRQAKAAVRTALKKESKFALTIAAKVDGSRIHGSVTATGPAAERFVTVYVVEKGVVFAGQSKIVVHHMVVRDRLADVPYKPGEPIKFDLDFGDRTRGSMRQIPVDPRQLAVVAMVRGGSGTRIYQAAYAEPTR